MRWDKEDTKEEKDNKNGHGKIEKKGESSPQHMVQQGATSSTSFVGVPPPSLSPHRGGAAPRPRPVVGGASGHVNLEPPAKFTGKIFLIV